MATKKKKAQPEAPKDNVKVITVAQAMAAANAGDLDTVQEYINLAGNDALKGIVKLRDEMLER